MKRDATHGTDDGKPMETMGEEFSTAIRFEQSGGACALPECDDDAPFVVSFGKRLALPCRAHADEVDRRRRADEIAARAADYITRAGVTSRMQSWSFESYREACGDEAGLAALAVAEKWCSGLLGSVVRHDDNDRVSVATPNLLFYGPVGSGKTGLACAMVKHLCEHGVEAKLITFRKMLESMRDAYAAHVSVSRWFNRMLTTPVVVFDDLGSEVPTKWAREQLLGIVDERYERRLPTVYVSNYTPDALAKRLGHDDPIIGDRIVSRMAEGSVQHRFRADDRRRAVV